MKQFNQNGFRRQILSRRGAALATTLVFLLGFAIMGAAYFTLTTTFSNLTNRASNKTQATALAEAGVHRMYAQVSSSLLTNGLPTTTAIGNTTLNGQVGATSVNDGKFSATVLSTTGPTLTTQAYGANGTETTSTYTFTVQGVGTAPNGVQSIVQAVFTDTQEQTASLVAGSGNSFTFPNAAIVSNSNVSLVGNSATHSQVTIHAAGISANGVVSGNGNYSVDGPIDVAPASYSGTVQALGSSPNDFGNTITQMASPVSFPSTSTITTWISTYQGESKEATVAFPTGQIINGGYSPSGTKTLTAPAYINGDLSLSGNSNLTINADPTVTGPVVVYVHGNIKISGNSSMTNNGILLVSDGTVSISGNGNGYLTSATGNTASGLIDFSSASNAVTLVGNGNGVGLVYAVNGGITVKGNGSVTGSLIAGGTGSSGGIGFTGNATLYYPSGLNTNFTGIPPANQWQYSTPQSYTPTSLSSWLQTL